MSQRAPLLFNPSRASFNELEKTFVGRWPQLEALERDLLADGVGPTTRHWLLIGPRGSGKSHFTELLARRLRQNHGWAVVRLPEEHYQVASVAELLEQILIRLEGLQVSPFALERDPRRVEERALDRLRAWKQEHGKPFLVIIENLGLLLDRKLTARRDQSRLREVLMQEPAFILLATATSYVDATVEHSAPFYDFFQISSLDELSRAEVTGLVEARARWDQDENLLGRMEQVRPRLDAIFHFSGGNPRLVLALYGILRHGVTEELHTQLLELLDEVTPYYQARLNDVSPQMVRIVTEMAVAEGPLTPAELGRRTRLSTTQVTANITKLVNERFVRPGGRPEDQRSRYYELTDRLFRLWLQMREGEHVRQRLRFLTEFFQRWYGWDQEELYRDTAHVAQTFWQELQRDHAGRCKDLLTTLDYLSSTCSDEHGSLILQQLNDALPHVGSNEPWMVFKLKNIREELDQSEQRTAVSYVLAQVLYGIGQKKEALEAIEDGIEKDEKAGVITWSFYLSLLFELHGAEFAYANGVRAIEQHPELHALNEMLCYLSHRLGKADAAELHFSRFMSDSACDECRQRVSMRHALELLQADELEKATLAATRLTRIHDGQDTIVNFLRICVASARGERLTLEEILDEFEMVGDMEVLPAWVLESAAHIFSRWRTELEKPFNPIKRLQGLEKPEALSLLLASMLELLTETLAQGEPEAKKLEEWLSNMYGEADVLAEAFRTHMPQLARVLRLRPHVLECYRRLRESGALAEDIPPYSTALAVQEAPSRERALSALHPEMREAVALLLGHASEEVGDSRRQSTS